MVEFEADDAMAAAAAIAAADDRVDQVIICTPDKDLGQCVGGDRVVQLDRRKGVVLDEAGVIEKFGVGPELDPRLPGAGRRQRRRVPRPAGLGRQVGGGRAGPLRATSRTIPAVATDWDVDVRGAGKLAVTLQDQFDLAYLFRRIATVEVDAPTITSVDELAWTGPARRAGGGVRARSMRPGSSRGPSASARSGLTGSPSRRRGPGVAGRRSGGGLALGLLGDGGVGAVLEGLRVGLLVALGVVAVSPSFMPFSNSFLAEPRLRASCGSFAPPMMRAMMATTMRPPSLSNSASMGTPSAEGDGLAALTGGGPCGRAWGQW